MSNKEALISDMENEYEVLVEDGLNNFYLKAKFMEALIREVKENEYNEQQIDTLLNEKHILKKAWDLYEDYEIKDFDYLMPQTIGRILFDAKFKKARKESDEEM